MTITLEIRPDLEALVQRRLATGAFANAEDVIRRALETLDAEESWTEDERRALDEKIGRALEQSPPAGSTDRKKRGGSWPN